MMRAAALTLGAAALGLGVDAFFIEPYREEVVRRPMPLEHLPDVLVGRTLLQLSDIHVGREVSSRYLLRCFEQASALAPDFVVFTGDFISLSSAHEFPELARVLRAFPH